MVRNRPSDNDYDDMEEEVDKPLQKKQEQETQVQIVERAVTLELINDKLNYIISKLNKA